MANCVFMMPLTCSACAINFTWSASCCCVSGVRLNGGNEQPESPE